MSETEIELLVNGSTARAAAGTTLESFLEQLHVAGPGRAVAVNGEVMRGDRLAKTVLAPGDRIEIIQAVGGG